MLTKQIIETYGERVLTEGPERSRYLELVATIEFTRDNLCTGHALKAALQGTELEKHGQYLCDSWPRYVGEGDIPKIIAHYEKKGEGDK